MNRTISVTLVLMGLSATWCSAAYTDIGYAAENVGGIRWQYTYTVRNISLTSGIEEFTIWFDVEQYANLQIESAPTVQSEWSEVIWQPEPSLLDDGGYDAIALTAPVAVGDLYSGFKLSFDWLQTGTPGPQAYEVIDPDTIRTVDSGSTILIPEPCGIILVLLGGCFARLRSRSVPSTACKTDIDTETSSEWPDC